MNSTTKTFVTLVLLATAVVSITQLVRADSTNPLPPTTLTPILSERLNDTLYGAQSVDAQAGNVTELTIIGTSPSVAWQGYYGNITGTISLEDAQGNVFYDWADAEPQGEVYSSVNSSIAWSNIRCWMREGDTFSNLSIEETKYGMPSNAVYGIDETFNSSTHPEIVVGTYNITQNTCNTTYIYVNSAWQTSRFVEVLLSDNLTLVFTSIIENRDVILGVEQTTDQNGFDGRPHDFQMLVAENGQGGNEDVTPYYFWVELS